MKLILKFIVNSNRIVKTSLKVFKIVMVNGKMLFFPVEVKQNYVPQSVLILLNRFMLSIILSSFFDVHIHQKKNKFTFTNINLLILALKHS